MDMSATGSLETVEQKHWYGLHTSSRLTSHFRRARQPMATDVTPEAVLEILNGAGVRPVLMGTHAINTWRSEPRATQDVDVLVRKKDVRKAVRALHRAFPRLTMQDLPVVTRFFEPSSDKSVLDVMKPSQEIFHAVFRYTIDVGETHEIPDLEMTLASKFAALVSPHRVRSKKAVDIGDFMDVVLYNRDELDLKKLIELADKVYPNGGVEMAKLVDAVFNNRKIEI